MKKLIIAGLLLMVPYPVFAGTLPDTAQTECYDSEQEIICPKPGEDFYGQDANYAPCNPHSYARLSGGIMVQDNVTGLLWENKTNDGSIHDKDNTYTWQDAQDVFVATLNAQHFGGHNDWRLPTIHELSYLVDSSIPEPGPTINTGYFPNTVSSGYWSSTTYTDVPLDAWFVDFYSGGVNVDVKSNYAYGYVRAVRGGPCGAPGHVIANGDGTVTDTDTGLMWQQDTAPNTYTWQQALSYCETLILGGYSDWRLPNRNELQSIVDYSRFNPAIDPIFNVALFPNYWSSTTHAVIPDNALSVYFSMGDFYSYPKSTVPFYVRAVRGGQCGAIMCPAEKIYGEHSNETELLRYFRDTILARTVEGRELIKLYYLWSPVIVKALEEDVESKQEIKGMVDSILPMIETSLK